MNRLLWCAVPVVVGMVAWLIAAPGPAQQPRRTVVQRLPAGEAADNLPALFRIEPVVLADEDEVLVRLSKERLNTAIEQLQMAFGFYEQGRGSVDAVAEAARRCGKAKLDLADGAGQIAIHEELLEVAKYMESLAERRFRSGSDTREAYLRAKYDRLTCQIELERLRNGKGAK